jgi:hypothetical protein
VFRMGTNKRNYVNILAAVIGGSAVVAMGALAMAIPQGQVAPDVAKSTNMTVGATATTTVVGRGHTDGNAEVEGPGTLAPRRSGAALTGPVRLSFHR